MFGNQYKFNSVMRNPGYNDPVSAAVSIGSNIIGGAMQSGAASDAAQMQADAAANQIALQKQIFDTQNKQLAPQRGLGYSGVNAISSLLGGQYQTYDAQGNPVVDKDGNPVMQTGTDYLTHQFNAQDLNANLAPNYQWQLGQGQQAINAQNNATGGLVGGNAQKALQDYTQNFAGNAYQNAFSNYNTQRGNIYNTLASIAGIGQSAQNATNTAASNYGTNVGNLATGAAAAQGAGAVGSANAWSGALGNAGNIYSLSNILGSGNQTFGSGTSNAAGGISLTGGGGGGNAVSNFMPSILI